MESSPYRYSAQPIRNPFRYLAAVWRLIGLPGVSHRMSTNGSSHPSIFCMAQITSVGS